MRIKPERISCAYMDLAELAHRDRVYPVMYCKLVIRGHFDLQRLKDSIKTSSRYIPEILYSVDFKRCAFVNTYHTVNDVFYTGNAEGDFISGWDLSADTQLKIFISQNNNSWNITIGMSHVLTDGAGFLQYLYLLSSIYNGITLPAGLLNVRDMDVLVNKIPFCIKKGQDYVWKKAICRDYEEHEGEEYHCLCAPVSETDLRNICIKARSWDASINDVLMAAYARVAVRRLGETFVGIPCPVDLRKICFEKKELTIGNMTGVYRSVPVAVAKSDPFEATLLQIHKEMRRQRENLHCLYGIKLLRMLYGKVPARYLLRLIRTNYNLDPVSYTNIGKIDSDRLYFADCSVESCYITGTYRKAPDFQLSVSTFKNVCTLNCTLYGNRKRKIEGEALLREIHKELAAWVDKGGQ